MARQANQGSLLWFQLALGSSIRFSTNLETTVFMVGLLIQKSYARMIPVIRVVSVKRLAE